MSTNVQKEPKTTVKQSAGVRRGRPALWLLLSLVIVALDQLTKWLAITYIKGQEAIDCIPGVLRFTYLENRGAAFGSFSNNRWVFMILSTVMIVGLIVYLLKYSYDSCLIRCILAFFIGGGFGNMIDRVTLGYVVDMIDFYAFPQIWSYVFNVADSFVVIGAGIMVIYALSLIRVQEGQPASQPSAEQTPVEQTENPTEPDMAQKIAASFDDEEEEDSEDEK